MTTTYQQSPALPPVEVKQPTGTGRARRRPSWRRRAGRALAAAAALAALYLAATPDGRWLLRAACEEGRILARRRPIAELATPASGVDARTRGKLQLVLAARAFAAESLGLRAGRSFTQYTDIGRDTLLLLLTGARRDTLAPVTWWFPVVGRVPYKGFFDWRAARGAADALRRDGRDAYLRPASAFSTLGWFDDPLLNTTLAQDSVDLANTVVHEITHNEFYAPGQAAFNESFASFVGARGSERFFRQRGDTAAAAEAARRWGDDQLLGAFWARLGRAVDSAYAAHPGDGDAARRARIEARAAVTTWARGLLADSVAPRLSDARGRGASAERLRAWAARVPLDNAALLARRTYARDLPLFDAVLAREGGDVRRAVRRVVALARAGRDDPFAAVRAWVRVGVAGTGAGRGGAPTNL
jgi:predicted aminopeptidase